ncbi:amidohydrolase [Enterovibrio calviensis]|uniref:amidohydrolase n=1 Tax=Enterovibrio calviensis TaxID=91359 RepID=UPI003734E808
MSKLFKLSAVAATLAILAGCSNSEAETTTVTQSFSATFSDNPITVYVSNQIITMSDDTAGNAIAVQDGKILAVGEKKNILSHYESHSELLINTDYQNKVITPGFVEPHVHLWMSGILLGAELITPADWKLPWGDVDGVQGSDAYFARLAEIEAQMDKPTEPLLTWGYHHYFHDNDMSKEKLNEISSERPIIVWHRSFHELFFNDAALELLGWTEETWTGEGRGFDQVDWERGHIYENGMKMLAGEILSFIMSTGRFATGMERTRDYAHSGGITTVVDPGVAATPDMYKQMVDILMEDTFPMDYWLMPLGNLTYMAAGDDAEAGKAMAEGMTLSPNYPENEQIRWLPKYIKLFSDGAMYSQLMQLKDGYTDGHKGEWIQTPDELMDSMRPYWKDDYTVLIHMNGDIGFESSIDVVQALNEEYPRDDHRTSFHHLGITDIDDIPRAVEAGANFSVNPFYTHILAELYSEQGVGKERAEEMSRGRSFIDAGGILSLHSDAPMAPSQPLVLAWSAVNRIGLSGETVMGPQERITVDEAMRAITIDAAYTARLEDKIGTLDVGKYADFTILDSNPYLVEPEAIKDINVEATVYRGVPATVASGTSGAGLALTDKTQNVLSILNSSEHAGHDHADGMCETSIFLQKKLMEVM